MAVQTADDCPDCGTPMVPSFRGMRCPRLGACGRGGIEERGTGRGVRA